ncbi:MAG: AI-2E family transporter [Lachnospiraceae bacterium]|nr:AI-2E family transporter [Lachnospiraceae bacterium]
MITINRRFSVDKKYFKISVYVLAIIICCIAFEKLLENIVPITGSLGNTLSSLSNIVLPFIYGFFIAYFLNPLVSFIQRKGLSRIAFFDNRKKGARLLSIFITYIIVLGGIAIILYYIIPEMLINISNIINRLPDGNDVFQMDYDLYHFIEYVPYIDPEMIQDTINSMLEPLISRLEDIPAFIQTFITGTILAASNVLKFLLGILLAFYMLYEKDNTLIYGAKFIRAMFKEEKAEFILYNLRKINETYYNFILGKAIDSLIIGILCFIGASLLKIPYSLLIAVIIGVTNIIPYFGPFIGAIPSIAIVLLVNPMSAVILTIFILVLQQFDGNILGPRILSSSVGMSALWIIFSVTVGGSLFGFLGMFLGVPTVAVIKMFIDEAIDLRYKKNCPSFTEGTAGVSASSPEESE